MSVTRLSFTPVYANVDGLISGISLGTGIVSEDVDGWFDGGVVAIDSVVVVADEGFACILDKESDSLFGGWFDEVSKMSFWVFFEDRCDWVIDSAKDFGSCHSSRASDDESRRAYDDPEQGVVAACLGDRSDCSLGNSDDANRGKSEGSGDDNFVVNDDSCSDNFDGSDASSVDSSDTDGVDDSGNLVEDDIVDNLPREVFCVADDSCGVDICSSDMSTVGANSDADDDSCTGVSHVED